MNLLIDFLTAHGKYGAGEYQRRVVYSLIGRIKSSNIQDVNLFALYDSAKEISYEDLREENLGKQIPITYCNLHESNLLDIIKRNRIDRFFIACGQRIGEYSEVADVKCEVVCVTHDMLYEEWFHNHMYEYWQLLLPSLQIQKPKGWKWSIYFDRKSAASILARYLMRIHRERIFEKRMRYMENVSCMLKANAKAKCIMVSEYSKYSLMYNYQISAEQIEVLYSPERIEVHERPIENEALKELIHSRTKYYLMISCDRESKNPVKAYNAFRHFLNYNPDSHAVMIGMRPIFGNCYGRIHAMDFLSDSDLIWAIKGCYALVYPSFFEGFGYPPLEAMKYGKPVICSNTTSMPEILGNAPIYCSPLYESAIFMALMQLKDENYYEYVERSKNQYVIVHERQEKDLRKLIDMILAPMH